MYYVSLDYNTKVPEKYRWTMSSTSSSCKFAYIEFHPGIFLFIGY